MSVPNYKKIGNYELLYSRRTGLPYYFNSLTNKSYWYDEKLPSNWAWGRTNNNDNEEKFYINLLNDHIQLTIPDNISMDPEKIAIPSNSHHNTAITTTITTTNQQPEHDHNQQISQPKRGKYEQTPTSNTSVSSSFSSNTSSLSNIHPEIASLQFHPMMGDSPFLSLVRQEWLSWHHRTLTLEIAKFWPVSGNSKSIKSCYMEGLLPGLQGIHARFLFSQLQSQSEAGNNIINSPISTLSSITSNNNTNTIDPLLPYAPHSIEKDIVKELFGWGIPAQEAERIVTSLAFSMGQASTGCAQLRNELINEQQQHIVSTSSSSLSSSTNTLPNLLPLWGTLKIIPAIGQSKNDIHPSSPNSTDDTTLLLIYEPDINQVQKWLSPIRSWAPIPSNKYKLFGPLNIPLYTATSQKEVHDTLKANNIPITPFTSVLILRNSHIEKLSLLYRLKKAGVITISELQSFEQSNNTNPVSSLLSSFTVDTEFLQRVYCMLARYETFTGNASGLQGALPHHIFDSLETILTVDAECFASPLNTHFPRFCSAFPDTDIPFGSFGSFFDYQPEYNKAYEANPPFVNDTMLAMTKHIERVLEKGNEDNEYLLFFVIVPSWSDALFHQLLATGKFTRIVGRLSRKEHEYIDGLQYRVNTRTTWSANVDSSWFVLATEKAAKTIADIETPTDATPITSNQQYEHIKQRIFDAFKVLSSTIDPVDRVVKFYPLPKVII